ncbi:MAG TPA: formylglycine-generating enzyme family protein, partial [Stellaceae bacterium]|nr:formylglycine-generating enzyme family protein [Stellaceae bacterium]
RPKELWRHTAPYRGLAAMTEGDADFFFGRVKETQQAIEALATQPEKLHLLLGNSGVGKSSLAQAGVLATLMRQGWPEAAETPGGWPQALHDSRHWCYLKLRPGSEPVRALVEPFLRLWQLDAVDPGRARLLEDWVSALKAGKLGLRNLMDATQARYRDELSLPEPPAFLLYVDQGEELYARGEAAERRRFSEHLARGLGDPRLRMMLSLRADFLGEVQKDEPIYEVHRLINVTPLRAPQLREVVGRPPALLSARFASEGLAEDIAARAAEESVQDAGALPLLSYLLDDMWREMVRRGDGVLHLPAASLDLGGVLVRRANAFLAERPGSEAMLRRILTLKLATVHEGGEPTRRRALRSEFSEEEWRLVGELTDHPYRLLVTATPEHGEAYAEVAHEAIFRRWDRLRQWVENEREFLVWKNGIESARRQWQKAPRASKPDALLMGLALAQARDWHAKRAEALEPIDREFIDRSLRRERTARGRSRLAWSAALALPVIAIAAWVGRDSLWDWIYWFSRVRPYVQQVAMETKMPAGKRFQECDKDCPEMIVLRSGEFVMGSPPGEAGHSDLESPQHRVVIAEAFAVSIYDVTNAEYDVCVSMGGCPGRPISRHAVSTRPVIDVSWNDAVAYVTWLSYMTGRHYRLLTEAEWEYSARAGTTTVYFWGDEIGEGHANYNYKKPEGVAGRVTHVDTFSPNPYGLYDMAGNVWQWVQDCLHVSYAGAPTDGTAAEGGDCSKHVVRGGSWLDAPEFLRSAARGSATTGSRNEDLGFRIARTLGR